MILISSNHATNLHEPSSSVSLVIPYVDVNESLQQLQEESEFPILSPVKDFCSSDLIPSFEVPFEVSTLPSLHTPIFAKYLFIY